MEMIVTGRQKMSEFVKPWVYNPRVTEEKIAELEARVTDQMWSIMKLKEENTNLKLQLDSIESLKRIIDIQQNTINTYNKIFKLQEAELEKLRGNK